MPKILIKKGLSTNLPTLTTGELALTTDTQNVYIGNNGTNVLIGGKTNNDTITKLQNVSTLGATILISSNNTSLTTNAIIPFPIIAKLTDTMSYSTSTNKFTINDNGVFYFEFYFNSNGLTDPTGDYAIQVFINDIAQSPLYYFRPTTNSFQIDIHGTIVLPTKQANVVYFKLLSPTTVTSLTASTSSPTLSGKITKIGPQIYN